MARRAVLISQARARAKANDWDAVAELMKELGAMRPASAFLADVSALRITAQKAARARRDRATEERVLKLCADTTELVNNYLDEEKLRELRDDIAQLKQVAADIAAAENEKANEPARPSPSPDDDADKPKKKRKRKSAPAPAQDGVSF